MEVDSTIVKDSHNREAFTTQKLSEARCKQLTHEQFQFLKVLDFDLEKQSVKLGTAINI